MASLNQVSIIGYMGDAPKVRQVQSGGKMATMSVATTERGFTKPDGTRTADRTEWHSVVVFGRLAEVVGMYANKGSQVFVQGKLTTRQYESKSGEKRYATEIVAEQIQLLDKRQSDAAQHVTGQSATPYNPTPNDNNLPF